jgi:Zn-dependent peptidase ImmA (M78 family)
MIRPGTDTWWKVTQDDLARSSRDRLFGRMMQAARQLAPLAFQAGPTQLEQWATLGVSVEEALIDTDGWSGVVDGERRVLVTRRWLSARRRFTIAHETGHLLLHDRRQSGHATLKGRAEETLCDRFGGELLMPREVVASMIGAAPITPDILVTATSHFQVNFQVSLQQLSSHLERDNSFAFVASRRGSKSDPTDAAWLRGYQSRTGDGYYMPAGRKLRKDGFDALDQWALHASTADIGEGVAPDAHIHLWRPGGEQRSGHAHGSAVWRARKLQNGLVVVVVDVSRMRQRWSSAAVQAA